MELKIAICDDSDAERDNIAQSVRKYFSEISKSGYELDVFAHPDELLANCKIKCYDIFLLDILMPMVNGIEVARSIRESCPHGYIVFISTTTEFVTDAFSVNAAHYLVKPYTFERFCEAMEKVEKHVKEDYEPEVVLQLASKSYANVKIDRILYLESLQKFSMMHMLDQENLTFHYPLREMGNALSDFKQLVKLGSSYIVNMDNIRQLKDKCLVMNNDDLIPVPRRAFAEFRELYMCYYCPEGENEE